MLRQQCFQPTINKITRLEKRVGTRFALLEWARPFDPSRHTSDGLEKTLGTSRRYFLEAYSDIFGTTEKALRLRSKRMELISGNIANADVDNYKSKDFDFKKIMSKELAGKLQSSHPAHISANDPNNLEYVYRVPVNPSDNGNTVELNYEQAQFGQEATRYSATLQFLESRVGGIRRALRGE